MELILPSAPSTPRLIGDYIFSAPSSPGRIAEFYREFDDFSITDDTGPSTSEWEEKPPKYEDDFAFDVSRDFNRNSLSAADELFDGGIIKPLMPPTRLQMPTVSEFESESLLSRSPAASPMSYERTFRGASSPRKAKESEPRQERERGRGRDHSLSTSASRRARSYSPLRISDYLWEEEQIKEPDTYSISKSDSGCKTAASTTTTTTTATTTALTTSSSKGFMKWRLRDFFLFRSASDGRAMDKDPLKKFFRKQEDVRNSSSRKLESSGSGFGSSRRRVSAHELHYTANRAAANDKKKKTYLPYKQGILARFTFTPPILANGFGTSHQ